MNLTSLKSLIKSSILVVVMTSGLTYSQIEAQENKAKEVSQVEEEKVAEAKKSAGEIVIALLRAFTTLDNNDSRSLNDFSVEIVTVLEDPVKAEEFKKEYPNIDIKALIAALKKVQNNKSAVAIGRILKPFFKYLPQDLQDISLSTLWAVIKKRIANQK